MNLIYTKPFPLRCPCGNVFQMTFNHRCQGWIHPELCVQTVNHQLMSYQSSNYLNSFVNKNLTRKKIRIFYHSREYAKIWRLMKLRKYIMFTSETIKHLIQLEKKIHCFYMYNLKTCPYMKSLQYWKMFVFRKRETIGKNT